jgi:glycosyltransferase involved in cell wall biosynthesis
MTNYINKPLISVIIPTYNRSNVVNRAIDSIIKQTYDSWEILIVDDGSTDNTKDIVEKYLKNNKISYFYKNNGGVSSARNFGIKKANGEYIAFLDSDDEFEEEKLDIQLKEMKKNNVVCSISNSVEIQMSGKKLPLKYTESFIFDREFFLDNEIRASASSFMIKNDKTILFNEKLLTNEDVDFLLKYLINDKILFASTSIVRRYKYLDNVRLSVNPKAKIIGNRERIELFKNNEYKISEDFNLKYISSSNLNLGFWYLFEGQFTEGRTFIKKGLSSNQKLKNKIMYNILYYISFSPVIYGLIKRIGIFLWSRNIIRKD